MGLAEERAWAGAEGGVRHSGVVGAVWLWGMGMAFLLLLWFWWKLSMMSQAFGGGGGVARYLLIRQQLEVESRQEHRKNNVKSGFLLQGSATPKIQSPPQTPQDSVKSIPNCTAIRTHRVSASARNNREEETCR